MERPYDDRRHLQPPDRERERLRPITLKDLAVAHGEVVQRVHKIGVHTRLRLKAQELTVVFQDEVARPPVADVFTCKEEERSFRQYAVIPEPPALIMASLADCGQLSYSEGRENAKQVLRQTVGTQGTDGEMSSMSSSL